jgi:hypothetical protein
MAGTQFRGKSLSAVAKDVADGYFTINPLTLKKLNADAYQALYHQLKKVQIEIRNEKCPLNDFLRIRNRNAKLQRVHQSLVVLEHSAKEQKIPLT